MSKYLVTGAAGFLGRTVVTRLLERGAEVHALVLKDDPLAAALPAGVNVVVGDVCSERSMTPFFENANGETRVIHCAGIVSVATKPDERLYRVNVDGTRNVLKMCSSYKVKRLVYVSSVHAIPEMPAGTVMTEPQVIAPELVRGHYAKSKAMATRLVLDAAQEGLDVGVVFPSGIIGPGDLARGSITQMLQAFLAGKLPIAVKGGYDFVDVRDVTNGIIACAEHGVSGNGYILSGRYAAIREMLEIAKDAANLKQTVRCLPIGIAKWIAPFYERHSLRNKKPLYFTPYAVAVLASNGSFSHQAATQAFGYVPRPLRTTIRETVQWIQSKAMP